MILKALQILALLTALAFLSGFFYVLHLAAQGQARAEYLHSKGLLESSP